MKEDKNCYFGIEIEFTSSFGKIQTLLPLLERHSNILLKSTNPDDGYLYRDQSITPDGIFDYGFEIKTEKLQAIDSNYTAVKELLIDLDKTVTANDTCSIHIHFSRKKNSLKDHYMMLYEYLTLGYDKKYQWLEDYEMTNFNYANYTGCRNKYLYGVNRQITKNGYYSIDTDYDSKQFLYTINTVYNTIEYRGLRCHFANKLSIQTIFDRLMEVLDTFISLNKSEIVYKYKDKFKLKQ